MDLGIHTIWYEPIKLGYIQVVGLVGGSLSIYPVGQFAISNLSKENELFNHLIYIKILKLTGNWIYKKIF